MAGAISVRRGRLGVLEMPRRAESSRGRVFTKRDVFADDRDDRLAVSAAQNTVRSMVRQALNSRSRVGW